MMEPSEIERLLLGVFPDASIELEDLTGTQDHYRLQLVSAAFDGVSPIQRHRRVYAALGAAMAGPIHALTIDACTPVEHASRKGS